MVSTEAVFLTAVIDALESREVAVLDVPGAFMQADIDELVHVRFTGEMVSMLLHIDNDMYKDYVVTEKGKMVMYMELLKALYGTLCTARLFWQKLSKQLIDVWGFTPNKYDDCVVNKIINGHQMSVVWHVDDLKVSHVDGKEVDKFIMQMEETFGADAPLSVSHGKIHDYLGMNLNFRVKGEVRIDMEHYIDMMLQDAPGLCPHDLFFKTRWSQAKFHDLHVWGCPVYVLDKTLSDGKKLPRWTPRSHREVFMALAPSIPAPSPWCSTREQVPSHPSTMWCSTTNSPPSVPTKTPCPTSTPTCGPSSLATVPSSSSSMTNLRCILLTSPTKRTPTPLPSTTIDAPPSWPS